MASVVLTGVKKIYDNKVVAVHDFNLDIKDKEFVVFVGPSGCGKSTTLRMIAGLEDISEGTVEIDGTVVNDLQPKDRDIAMVFQNYALYPHFTVYENMAFSLRLRKSLFVGHTKREIENFNARIANLEKQIDSGKLSPEKVEETRELIVSLKQERDDNTIERYMKLPEEVIYEKVINAAEILGITEYLDRKPRALSGGQRQRVAIGRAMVRNAKVFLMDEPLSNLDAKLRNQMRAEIILLRKKLDTTFIYVTHDQTEAMTLGDRIVIMKDGFIQQVGTPTEVFDRPDNLFVAEFIGAPKMNIADAKLIEKDGAYSVEVFGKKLPITGDKAKELGARKVKSCDIKLGVRPEHIVLAEKGENSIPATVEVNEMMGSEIHLHVVTENGTKLVVRVPTISLDSKTRESLAYGGKVNITFESKVMHFFNSMTTISLLSDKKPEDYIDKEEIK